MEIKYLSHVLEKDTPTYGNHGFFHIIPKASLSRGGTCNETSLEFNTHIGTHIDAPFHFDENGKSLDSYEPSFWCCDRIHLINYSLEQNQILSISDFQPYLDSIPLDSEFLILKTGFEEFRNNPEIFCFQNPVLDPEIPIWLRKKRNLKFFGIDVISFGSKSNRELGRQTHKNFLCEMDGFNPPILLVEDMKLQEIQNSPGKVTILPLRFSNSDGGPCTIIAEIYDL